MFLKFGRDDETQADDLGFRYMTAQTYEPSEMTEVFRTLARTRSAARIPGVALDSPRPGEPREQDAGTDRSWTRPAGTLKTNRDAFLMAIDGIVFGEDPRRGTSRRRRSCIPPQVPAGFSREWTTANQPSQVAGISGQQDAIIALTLAGTASPSQAAREFLQQDGIVASGTSTAPVNGLPAAVGRFTVQAEEGVLSGYAAFIQLDESTYRILAYTPQARIGSYDGTFRQAIGSFRRLTDPAALAVKPSLVRLVQIRSAMTLTQFQQQYPSSIPIEQLAVINGAAAPSTSFPVGSWLKRVAAE